MISQDTDDASGPVLQILSSIYPFCLTVVTFRQQVFRIPPVPWNFFAPGESSTATGFYAIPP